MWGGVEVGVGRTRTPSPQLTAARSPKWKVTVKVFSVSDESSLCGAAASYGTHVVHLNGASYIFQT